MFTILQSLYIISVGIYQAKCSILQRKHYIGPCLEGNSKEIHIFTTNILVKNMNMYWTYSCCLEKQSRLMSSSWLVCAYACTCMCVHVQEREKWVSEWGSKQACIHVWVCPILKHLNKSQTVTTNGMELMQT
jgi:hypothetical protein